SRSRPIQQENDWNRVISNFSICGSFTATSDDGDCAHGRLAGTNWSVFRINAIIRPKRVGFPALHTARFMTRVSPAFHPTAFRYLIPITIESGPTRRS